MYCQYIIVSWSFWSLFYVLLGNVIVKSIKRTYSECHSGDCSVVMLSCYLVGSKSTYPGPCLFLSQFGVHSFSYLPRITLV